MKYLKFILFFTSRCKDEISSRIGVALNTGTKWERVRGSWRKMLRKGLHNIYKCFVIC
jgi:hypothetical protein